MAKRKPPAQRDLFGDLVVPEPTKAERSILPLDFEGRSVRVFMKNGEPWWVAPDVCRAIGLRNSSKALARLDKDEKSGVLIRDPHGREQETRLINESGLFALILSGRTEEAKRFRKWVTSDVLPTLRRTGTYTLPTPRELKARRTAKKLRCNLPTAGKRLDVGDANKFQAERLYEVGATPAEHAAMHNAGHRGLTGKTAAELRQDLGLKPTATPLDRMGFFPLRALELAKAATEQLVKDLGGLPMAERLRLMELNARKSTESTLDILGPGYGLSVVADEDRGLVIDFARVLEKPDSTA